MEDEEGELFRIETNLFDYEIPLCKEFNEFNYLLKIDVDVFTGDFPGLKTYETFKNTWLYEWNNQVPWVYNKLVFYDEFVHRCDPICFKNGTCEWPSYDWKNDGICNGGSVFGMRRVGNDVYFKDYDWYDQIEDCPRKAEALQEKGRIEYLKEVKGASDTTFWEWVHKDCDDYTRLDRRLQWELKRKWDEIQDYHQSIKHYPYEKAYENYDDSQRKLMEELDDYLIKDDYYNFINEGEEEFNKRKCKLLGIT